jgi:hypothetical protein
VVVSRLNISFFPILFGLFAPDPFADGDVENGHVVEYLVFLACVPSVHNDAPAIYACGMRHSRDGLLVVGDILHWCPLDGGLVHYLLTTHFLLENWSLTRKRGLELDPALVMRETVVGPQVRESFSTFGGLKELGGATEDKNVTAHERRHCVSVTLFEF